MATTPTALTPEQVNSFPVSTKQFSLRGERVAPGPSAANPDEAFMNLALERFKLCVEAEGDRRAQMLMDLQFRCGDDSNNFQWEKTILQQRARKRRPCHTINRIPEFTKHVVNNMRQSRPSIKVNPIGDGADQDQAEIRQGLIRHIENKSQAESAYDTSFEHMCIMGLGWMRIVDDWAAPDSFDQDLFVRWVANPFSVYSDPTAALADWSDMKYAFVVNDMLPSEFIARYGEGEAVSAANFQSIGDHAQYWMINGKIRVAEYFHIEQGKDVLCELENGKTTLFSKLPRDMYEVRQGEDGQLLLILKADMDTPEQEIGRARKCVVPTVYWSLITGLKKLKERKWKGPHIPLIPVIGNQFEVDGSKLINGMVRYAREIQRLYNYVFSTLTEVIALAPRNQFIAEVDQISEFRDMYERANIDPQAVLPYKMQVAPNGTPLPPPQRQSAALELSSLVTSLQLIDNMLKSIFGIYDASLGQRGPQESGLAINARKIESDTSTYDWGDNFIRALEYLGRQLNELLSPYYNVPGRVIQILREGQAADTVQFKTQYIDKITKQPKYYDLDDGKFSVEISTGPSTETRRKDMVKSALDLFKVYPQGLAATADLIVEAMDFPMHQAFAARLKKLLPANLQDPDPNNTPDPAVMQQQVAQMQQMIQQLTQALHAATDKNELEKMKQVMETFRTELTNETNRFIAELKAGSDNAKFLGDKLFTEADRVRQAAEKEFEASSEGAPPVQPGQTAAPAAPTVLAGQPTGG